MLLEKKLLPIKAPRHKVKSSRKVKESPNNLN
jgi:hypothetical protein